MPQPIPALVAGTGFGCAIHVPALRAAGFDVVGLVGNDPAKTAKRAEKSGIAASFTDLDEAITRTGAEVVSIATPPHTHLPLSLAAIARGCHVLCEKPFALDVREAQQMLDAAERAGVVNMVAHEFRWGPDRAVFGRAIAEGLIGEPRFVVIDQFLGLVADPERAMPGWWFDPAAGGGWLGAIGSHHIDQIRAWLGEFDTLSARTFLVSDREAEADDSFSLRFTMKNGVEGSMQQSAASWGPMAGMWRCLGSKGTLWIEGGKVMLADKAGVRELPVPDDLALPPTDPDNPMDQSALLTFTRLGEAMRRAILTGDAASPVAPPTFMDGLAEMQVIDAIRSSAQHGGALRQV